ncbi:MAG: glycosyl transferase [Henriciella sp.]|nr:glycosyl transferase [Henriciella sp.]
MADFHQNGQVATLHNLRTTNTEELEAQLKSFSEKKKIWLILPSLFSELEGEALPQIIDQISQAAYIDHVVIGLDQATEKQYRFAKEFFSKLTQDHSILWNDGPRLKAVDEQLSAATLAPRELGKGRNVWYCFGYTIARGQSDVVALHDCDILTYSRDMLARLLYPVCHPNFSYQFSKGFYPRVAGGTLNGRVNRLLVTPLLNALCDLFGELEYLSYLKSFRYALSGEFAMHTSLLKDIRVPSDWGLEIGVLSEAFRNLNSRKICQVELADNYDHKHQPLSESDANAGLSRMSRDISKALFRKLAIHGVVFHKSTFRTLRATYYRTALDLIEAYDAVATMNGLTLDRHKEERAVELFASNIVEAGTQFLETPMETPLIPNWTRIEAADSGILSKISDAVAGDMEEFS